MNLKELKALIVDDDIFKARDIKKALEFNGISNIKMVDNQAMVWECIENGEEIDLIVTDMHYPLEKGIEADENAGFILIDKLKEKGITIPVIICSSINYRSDDALGVVWYNKIADIEFDFKKVLSKLK